MPTYTKKEQFELIRDNVNNLNLIDNQYEDVCLEAVKQDGYVLRHVKNKTEKICLEAVKRHGCSIVFVDNQTHEICLEAVKQDGDALEFIKIIDNELCFYGLSNILKTYSCSKLNVEEFKIKNVIFLIVSDNILNYIDDYICENCIKNYSVYINNNDYNDIKVFEISLDMFENIKEYLVGENINNSFIVDESIGEENFKKIALSNNELIYIKKENEINNLYAYLANSCIAFNNLIIK